MGRGAATVLMMTSVALVIAPRASAQDLRPPTIVSLAAIELATAAAEALGPTLEVVVIVDANGVVSIETADLSPGVRSALERALAASSIAPATRDGVAIASRARVRFEVRAPAVLAALEPAANPYPVVLPDALAVIEPPRFSATARVVPRALGALTNDAREVRDLAGMQGDPYRVVETLPGVVPLLSGLPFTYVRGAPPVGSLYLYDDVPIPSLFHVAAGPSTVHGSRLGEVHFWPGVAPARYGRYVGGVIFGEGRAPEPDISGELELRLLDVNGAISVPVGPATIRASGRYGYPGPIVTALLDDISLDYWDYQVSADVLDEDGGRTRVLVMGAYDRLDESIAPLGTVGVVDPRIELHFHRVDVRHVRAIGSRAEIGAGFRFGYDRSRLGDAIGLELFTASPRIWGTFELGPAQIRVGGDLQTSSGMLERGALPDPAISASVFGGSDYGNTRTRTAISGYLEAVLPIPRVLRLELGLRVDAWITGRDVQAAPSPRGRLVIQVTDWLDLHGSVGLAHQLSVLLLPLPGFADLALDRGLQGALQSDLGAHLRLPLGFEIEAQAFFHYIDQVLLPELYVQDRELCVETWCTRLEMDPRARSRTTGLELFLRRDSSEDVSGWISYTLSEATAVSLEGFEFTPSYDARHVLQAVGRVRIIEGFEISARVFLRSGRAVGGFFLDLESERITRFEQRLPWFFRADVEAAYAWDAGWGRLRITAGWMNVTMAAEPFGLLCAGGPTERPTEPCTIRYAPPLFLPSLGIRAEL